MKRREFFTLLGSVAAWPLDVRAQPQRIRRIGVLTGVATDDPQYRALIEGFTRRLADLGWIGGRNATLTFRSAADAPQLAVLAQEMIAQKPDVIVGQSTAVAHALQQATRTIPIVFVNASDPVGNKLIASLARPGGNLTGFTNFEFSIGSKWLGLLKQIAPGIGRVGIVFNPQTSAGKGLNFSRPIEASAVSFAVEAMAKPVNEMIEIDRAIEEMARMPGAGLIITPDPFTVRQRASIIARAAHHRLPALYPFRFFVADGGLVSYGIDFAELLRQAASYVDRILKGEAPADLPVQAPTKFELAINLKTAQALKLEVPPTLLALADEVIE